MCKNQPGPLQKSKVTRPAPSLPESCQVLAPYHSQFHLCWPTPEICKKNSRACTIAKKRQFKFKFLPCLEKITSPTNPSHHSLSTHIYHIHHFIYIHTHISYTAKDTFIGNMDPEIKKDLEIVYPGNPHEIWHFAFPHEISHDWTRDLIFRRRILTFGEIVSETHARCARSFLIFWIPSVNSSVFGCMSSQTHIYDMRHIYMMQGTRPSECIPSTHLSCV